jgi:hypothetical protein
MQTIPPEQWERFCAELSGALQGYPATFVTAGAEPELIAERLPFDGLHLAGDAASADLLACAGGRALYAATSLTGIAYGAGDETSGPVVVLESAGAPVARVLFAPARRAARPLRERSVG